MPSAITQTTEATTLTVETTVTTEPEEGFDPRKLMAEMTLEEMDKLWDEAKRMGK